MDKRGERPERWGRINHLQEAISKKKLTDIGFCIWLSTDLEILFRTVLQDIGRFEGLDPLSINLGQK